MSAHDAEILADVRDWLGRQAPLEEALAEAVSIRSHPATLAQNDIIDVVDQIVRHDSVRTDRWVPDWEAVEAFPAPDDAQKLWSPLTFRDDRYADVLPALEVAVHATGSGRRSLMFNGHSDVVPAVEEEWTKPVFGAKVDDGRLYGRGSMDMKAGLIASAYAFRYLAEQKLSGGTVLLATVPEEETGGNGTLAVLQRGWVPDAAVFAEPTDLEIVHRHVGIQGFDITLAGREGGMLRRSWADGVAPTVSRIGVALEALEMERTARAKAAGGYDDDDLPGFVNFIVHAGDWPATRPGSGKLSGLMGLAPGETQDDVARELEAAVLAAAGTDTLRVSVHSWSGGHRGAELPVDHELVRAFALDAVDAPAALRAGAPDASFSLSSGLPTRAGTMVCDAKIMQGGGWAPSIAFGPIGGGLHAADEWVDLASTSALVGLLVRGSLRYLGE